MSFKCPVCNRKFDNFPGLIRHFQVHTQNTCLICNKQFRYLNNHLASKARSCDKHRIFYGLTCYHNWSRNRGKKQKREAREFAYDYCQED